MRTFLLTINKQTRISTSERGCIRCVSSNEGITVENIGQTLLGNPRELEANILGPRVPRSQNETDAIAEWLVERLDSPEFRPFFLKAAWRLNRSTLERHAATALELGKNPRAYFITLVKREKEFYAK